VQVKSGQVTLSGSVDSYWKKARAEDLVGDCAGVIRIDNKLAIVPDPGLIDQDIANDIVAAIDRNAAVEADDVTVHVCDGFVTLSGVVPTYAARRAAHEAALYTGGVCNVCNAITVSALMSLEQGATPRTTAPHRCC
jgi:osmotically-inducible protein OsmY